MVTSLEIMEQTLEYDRPERVARAMPEPWGSDMVHAGPVISGGTDWQQVDAHRWERRDEWGNTWARLDPHSKGEVVRGVLDRLEEVDNLPLPAIDPATAFEPARQTFAEHPGKFPVGHIPGFTFNICRKIRKLEQYLVDILTDRPLLRRLHDRVDDLLEQWIVGLGSAGARAVMFPEDWGTQLAPMISPSLFREEFFPRYRRLCSAAHDCGMRVFLHSCGKMTDLMPDMIAAGVNLFQFDQPRLHGIETLARWHGRVTYWCPVDIQVTLPRLDGDLIVADVQALLDQLWRGDGGFVAGYYGDNASLGIDPGWQSLACEQFVRFGTREMYAR